MKSICRGCGKTFGGMSGFDMHRVGNYDGNPPNYGRRCMTDDELAARKYEEIDGVLRNKKGVNPWSKSESELA